eukprot:TRINITY_DN2092_c0_g1_i1.p1 TRINITY_DN2092_c0_g1~~TRINITY_DN2092_c0_g1_i1.p1  ORF type:complete len:1144 (-),score=323.78 TRINITY_DN2092_c0_g1_i1:64-3462(-)
MLEHIETSNVLAMLPVSARKPLIQQVIAALKMGDMNIAAVTTLVHVHWLTEPLGHAFTLPIEDHEVIAAATEIYFNWLQGKQCPPAISNDIGNRRTIFKEVLRHMSNVFVPRNISTVDKQVELCNRVLGIFQFVAHRCRDTLDKETWHVFLKVVLGVCDYLLKDDNILSTRLSSNLLKVLFEVWMLSETTDSDMWHLLQVRVVAWSKFVKPLPTYWGAVVLGLTLKMLRIIYGNTEGTDNFIYSTGKESTDLSISNEFTLFAWNRTLHLLSGVTSDINNPDNFEALMRAVASVCEVLELVGSRDFVIELPHTQTKLPPPPDTNTLFRITAPWFFEAAFLEKPGLEKGRAVAFEALCNTVCRRPRPHLTPHNLAKFYRAISEGLRGDGQVICAIVCSTTTLFRLGLPGVLSLVPPFLALLKKVLPETKPTFTVSVPLPTLRRACIKILLSLICLPLNHAATPIFSLPGLNGKADGGADSLQKETPTVKDLRLKIWDLLKQGLAHELDPQNQCLLISAIALFVTEDIEQNTQLPVSAFNALLSIIGSTTGSATESVTGPVLLALLQAVSLLSQYHTHMLAASEGTVRTIFSWLVEVSEHHIRNRKDEVSDAVVCAAFRAILDWAMASDWLLNARSSLQSVLDLLYLACVGQKPKAREKVNVSPMVQKTAQCAIQHLIYTVGFFPRVSLGTSHISSVTTEASVLSQFYPTLPPHVAYAKYVENFFLEDSTILTVVDLSDKTNLRGVIIVRDCRGRHAWFTETKYYHKTPALPDTSPSANPPFLEREKSASATVTLPPSHDTYANLPTSASVLSEHLSSEQKQTQEYFAKFEVQTATLKANLSEKAHQLSVCVSGSVSGGPPLSRVLLSHLGYLSDDARRTFFTLNSDERTWKTLQGLDSFPERDAHSCVVLYVPNVCTLEALLSPAPSISTAFSDFVNGLGTMKNLATHAAFDHLTVSAGPALPYFSTFCSEIAFYVPAIFGAPPPKPEAHAEIVKHSAVKIIWVEWQDNHELLLTQFQSSGTFLHIVVYPLSSGLFRVRVINKLGGEWTDQSLFPLVDNMILSAAVLPSILRDAVLSLSEKLKHALNKDTSSPYLSWAPWQKRKLKIESIEMTKNDPDLSEFYASVLAPVREAS